VLYVFYDTNFTAADGTVVFAGSPNNKKVYKKVTASLSGTTVTIPSFTVVSTRDGLDERGAKISFFLYTTTGTLISTLGDYVDMQVPSTITSTTNCVPVGTCCTFADLKIYNQGAPLLPPDQFYTKTEVDQKIAGISIDASTQVFNVKTYGAIGDGTTDDLAALVAADAAAASSKGIVYLPPGTYGISAHFTPSAGVTIQG